AHVRVIVGDVNLVEELARVIEKWGNRFRSAGVEFAVGGSRMNAPMGMMKQDRVDKDKKKRSEDVFYDESNFKQAKEIFKKAVSEYRLFAVEGKEDLQTGWSKALPNPKLTEIPFELSYELDSRRYGPLVHKFYKLQNDQKHKLGKEVFPQGNYYIYRADERGGNAFEGIAWHKYIPEGEKVELDLGADGLVIVEDREMTRERSAINFDSNGNRVGWDETITRQFNVKNSRERAVPFKFTYHPGSNADVQLASADDSRFIPSVEKLIAEVKSSEPKHEQVDRQTVRWELSLPAQSTTPIKITYVLHYGTNATAN
ncbi:MAG: hypothetical protein ABI579_09445, partial [Candidatus Sumerlaeota bacterium]